MRNLPPFATLSGAESLKHSLTSAASTKKDYRWMMQNNKMLIVYVNWDILFGIWHRKERCQGVGLLQEGRRHAKCRWAKRGGMVFDCSNRNGIKFHENSQILIAAAETGDVEALAFYGELLMLWPTGSSMFLVNTK